MLREAYIAGFRTVIATSHYLEGKYIANRQQKERYIQLLQEILIKEKINIKVCNGSEVYNHLTLNHKCFFQNKHYFDSWEAQLIHIYYCLELLLFLLLLKIMY